MKTRKITLLLPFSMLAAGQAGASYDVHAGTQLTYDSNVFRVSPQRAALTGTGARSERIYQINAGGTARVESGLWTGTADAGIARNWYDRNAFLNNTSYQGRITAAKAGSVITFDGLASYSHALSSFGDIQLRVRNVQQLTQLSGRTGLGITPDIRFVVDGGMIRSTNSSDLLSEQDYRQTSIGAGIGYFTPLGNSIVLKVSRATTHGLNDRFGTINGIRISDRIQNRDDSIDLQVRYNPSVLTSIQGQLSYVDRKDGSLLGRPFNGLVGNVRFDYMPTDGLTVSATAGRRLQTQSLIFVDSVRDDYATVAVGYRLSAKSEVHGAFGYDRRRLNYDPAAFADVLQRRDNTINFGAGAEYVALRNLSLTLDGAYEKRTSNSILNGFDEKSVTIGARYHFGNTR